MNENFAYIASTNEMFAKNSDNCLFAEMPFGIGSFQVALGFPKKFPYATIINKAIRKSKENGQLDRILKKWAVKPKEDCTSGTGFASMGIENVIFAFGVIVGGLFFAFVTLSIEICIVKISSPKTKKFKFSHEQ
jgi:hypothetical protein